MTTAILAFTTLITATAALYFFLSERKLRGSLSKNEEDSRKRDASQAQVIHTTKLASLGQMVAGVAHEINTPLGFVKSNVEVVGDLLNEYDAGVTKVMTGVDLMLSLDASMIDRAKTAIQKARLELARATSLQEARELLDDSAEGLKQMSSLVLNLKGFARVDRDGMDTIDLNDSVRSALTIAGHQLRDRITIVEEFGDLPKVKCMPSQINQVFLNMITNAAQAMGERGTLTIRSQVKPNFVEVSFEDTGSGIPDDVLPKIFDPFFTTKPVGEGTGLGLSIVHKIIQGHGGAIRVKSQVGKGTTFFVELPLAQKPAARAA
jgi:two-component system, NtrC family, sensor kinase